MSDQAPYAADPTKSRGRLYPVSEIIHEKGVALVGLIPPEVQLNTVYAAGVLAANAAPEPALTFVHFLADPSHAVDPVTAGKVSAVVYNRMRNSVGFSAHDWKVAYNQVKALADRHQLDERALLRFVRFGYGHHAAAALTVMLRVQPEVVVKWLAAQDYVAITVALRAMGVSPDLFEALISVMPWRDMPTDADKANVRARFEALTSEEAQGIFELWRTHAFRRRVASEERVA